MNGRIMLALIASATVFGVSGAFLHSDTLVNLASAVLGGIVGNMKPWEYLQGRRPSGEHRIIERNPP